MENNNDKIISVFFNQNKTEISDNGFSKKVACSLPEKEKNFWIIPVFGLIGFYIALSLVDLKVAFQKIYLFIGTIDPLYFMAFIFSIPLVFLIFFFFFERKHPTFG